MHMLYFSRARVMEKVLFGDNRSLRFLVCATSVVHTFLLFSEEMKMKNIKQILALLFVLTLCAFGLMACDEDDLTESSAEKTTEISKTEPESTSATTPDTKPGSETTDAIHVHTPVTDPAVAATCTTIGMTEGSHCSECGEVIVAQEEIAATGHTEVTIPAVAATCTADGKTEGKHCSVCGKVIIAQTNIPAMGHTYDNNCDTICNSCIATRTVGAHNYGSDNKCTACGVLKPSEGLKFTINDDGVSYSVTGIGDCKDEDVVIPAIYKNLPVTSIGSGAFQNRYWLTSINIPEGVTSIGDYAFELI